MKPKYLIIGGAVAVVAALSLILFTTNKTSTDDTLSENTTNIGNAVNSETGELTAPRLEWWSLYNPNGFDTVTGIITNTNTEPIDVSYDLVYYKNGIEVARSEDFANFDIMAGKKAIIWGNYDIPRAADVDDIKMENVIVTKSTHSPIDGKYTYAGIVDGEAIFDFEFDQEPTLATIHVLLYNDENGNKQCDKDEIVVAPQYSLMEKTGRISLDTDVFDYTDFEVYFTAY